MTVFLVWGAIIQSDANSWNENDNGKPGQL
jgi:hypothetical protein